MKAQIINEHATDFIHDIEYYITRIVIPEKNNLVITLNKGHLYISDNFKMGGRNKEIISEFEIPESMVNEIIDIMNANKKVSQYLQPFLPR